MPDKVIEATAERAMIDTTAASLEQWKSVAFTLLRTLRTFDKINALGKVPDSMAELSWKMYYENAPEMAGCRYLIHPLWDHTERIINSARAER